MRNSLVILGVDPGLVNTGYAVLDSSPKRPKLMTSGVIAPLKSLSLENRILFLHEEIKKIVSSFPIEEASLEDVFFSRSTPTILNMAQARGALLVGILSLGVKTYSYTPTQIKQAITGNGRASKEDVAHMAGILLSLDTSSLADHITDAMAIALCHNFLRS